jgi:hypothetical protein
MALKDSKMAKKAKKAAVKKSRSERFGQETC